MNFIELYKFDENICDNILSYYNSNNHLSKPGTFGDWEINNKSKESNDLGIQPGNFTVLESYLIELKKTLQKYVDTHISKYLKHWGPIGIVEGIIIQHYPPNGGYKIYHTERSPETANRELVFMTYLTNTKNGGTHFINQNKTFECVKGDTLIWPADFTHIHKGVISNEEKIIITGWFSFK